MCTTALPWLEAICIGAQGMSGHKQRRLGPASPSAAPVGGPRPRSRARHQRSHIPRAIGRGRGLAGIAPGASVADCPSQRVHGPLRWSFPRLGGRTDDGAGWGESRSPRRRGGERNDDPRVARLSRPSPRDPSAPLSRAERGAIRWPGRDYRQAFAAALLIVQHLSGRWRAHYLPDDQQRHHRPPARPVRAPPATVAR
jgi:hypothetical protein